MKTRFFRVISLVLMITMLLASFTVSAAPPAQDEPPPDKKVQSNCALLDDPTKRMLMSAAFETNLLIACGRASELGQVRSVGQELPSAPDDLGLDVLINDPTGDVGGTSFTQSETSLARNDDISVICSAYNDSYHGVTEGTGFTGYSSSTDKGATWVDHGVVPTGGGGLARGDPVNVWSRRDDTFYHASLHTNGLGLWDLGSGCDNATWVAMIHTGGSDDKELMAVDNNPSSPYYGRLYVGWTDFAVGGGQIHVTYSDDGMVWSTPVAVSGANIDVQGAWPAVDPVTGDVYVAWVRWNPYSTGPIDVEVVRSTDGGNTFNFVTNPMTGQVNPYDNTATGNCGRPALNGDIRYLPSPQIVVDDNRNLHVVYSYDPDGNGTGDVIDVYYRRSTDQGATWGPEIQLNDDGTMTDQWFPALTVNDNGVVGTFWYDRRLDVTNNYMYDYYKAVSYDNGVTFQPNERVSDVSSAVVLDPNLATCYHGDYDTSIADVTRFYIQWSDDRGGTPDIWSDTEWIMTEIGVLEGRVTDMTTAPLADVADVSVQATLNATYTFGTTTDPNGLYSMMVMSGTYDVTAAKYGYQISDIGGVSVVSGTTTTLDIVLSPAAMYVVDGTVTDSGTGDPLWATIDISGDPFDPPTTTLETDPATGYYSITLAEDVTYTFDAAALLHVPTTTVIAPLTSDTTLDFDLDATTQEGLIAGWVLNYYTDAPIEGATVEVDGIVTPTTTNADGYFETAAMPAGFYTATASADLYSSVTITDIEVVTSNVALVTYRLPTARLEIAPMALEETVILGTAVTNTGQLVITNTGIGDLDWEIDEKERGFAPTAAPLAGEDVLVVYDTGTSARDAVLAALDNLGYTYLEVTSTDFVAMSIAELLEYGAVIYVGYPSSGTEDTQCMAYLDAGGNLLVSDNDFGYSQNSSTIYQTYFQANYVSDSGSDGMITGMDIMAGIDTDISSDPYPDDFTAGAEGVGIFQAPSGNLAGIRVERYDYKAIYFAWDYNYAGGSAVGDPVETTILGVALDWLITPPDVLWLSEDPISGTLTYSVAQPIDIGWHADIPEIDQPGEYYASLLIENNDPLAQDLQVPVTMTVDPPPGWGKLNGMVTSTGYCDVNPYSVEGAQVFLEGSGGYTYTLWTGDDDYGWSDGYYQRWLDSAESPYTVTVTYPEHPTTTISGISISDGVTVTLNVSLRWQQPCIEVTPDSISETLDMGERITVSMTISNYGAVPLDFELQENDGGYDPVLKAPADVDGVNILFDQSHGGSAATYDELIADLMAAGATVDIITVGPIDTALLSNYDIYWVPDSTNTVWSADELDDIEDWVHGGGGLFINYDCCNDATAPVVAARFDITYLGYGGGTGGVTSDILPHPTTEGVTALNLPSPYQSLAVGGSAEVVVNDVGGAPQVAVNEVGGRIVVVDDDSFNSGTYYNSNDNALFASNIFNWLVGAADVPWLSEDPITGTVAADGGVVVVDVVLDAGLVTQPGIHYATLKNRSNDPLGSVDTPVTMTVNALPTWGKLEGTVSSLGYCDINPAVLEDAEVLAESGTTISVTTNISGVYSVWLDGGIYTVTASFADHIAVEAVVMISGSMTTVRDFDLRSIEPCVSVIPLSMEATLLSGDSEVQSLRIYNYGAGATSFQIGEIPGTPLTGTARLPVSIPASTGDFQRHSAPVSIGRAPAPEGAVVGPAAAPLNPGPPAYGVDLATESLYYWDDVDVPGTWTLVGATGASDQYAGDFAGSDFSQIYIIDNLAQQLYSVNTTTGVGTLIGSCVPDPGQTWTGMSWDSTTGVMYASATDGAAATLFTVNLSTGAATAVGAITGGALTIDIAVDASGQMYGVVIDTDSLVAIDKNTGTATTIGSLNFDANYAQGLDFDAESGILYWAAFGASGELRVIDTTTGASASVGGFPGGAEVDAFAIPTSGGDVPWLSEDPITGTVSAEDYYDVDVTFTALPTMTSGTYTATLTVGTDDAVNGNVNIPVTMTVVGAANCSFISSSPDDVGSTTYFTNTSTGDPPLTSRWDFGDGSPISAAHNPTHDYAAAGWYTVILTVTNQPVGYPEFTSVCTDVVSIYGPPVASFDWSKPAVINQSVTFTDTSFSNPGGTNWSWQFGAGQGSSFVQNPVYTYTTPGEYVVTMMIDNGYGNDMITDVVRVFESACLPVEGVDFSWVEDPALFVSFEGSATLGTAQLPVTYTWDFGDGYFGVGQTVTHTYALSTTVSYTVSLTVANVCPSQQTIQKVIDLWPPTIYLPLVTRD